MVFPLKKVIEYAMKNPVEVDRAYEQFFGSLPFSELKPEWEELFLEWLIFDFRTLFKTAFIAEYILQNPDDLKEEILNQFIQIAETHHYSHFEVIKIKKGEWIEIEDLYSGKMYRVYDKKTSETIASFGTIPVRVAQVEGKWYLVGANSVFFPITHTARAKKNMLDINGKGYSPKETVDLLRDQEKNPPSGVPNISKEELKLKRLSLRRKYINLAKRGKITLSFEALIGEISQENKVNVLDFWKSLEKKGIKFEVLVNNMEIFQDIWNYFPHRCLNNLSPVEVFVKLKKSS